MAALLVACGAVIGALAAVGWVVSVAQSAPNLDQLTPRYPHPPTEIFAADGSLLGYVQSDTVFSYVSANMIPERMKQAIVAIEDRRFWQHAALDYQGILRAGFKFVSTGGHSLQGASTLTMQLVDNVYMPLSIRKNRNLQYKIAQAKLALQLAKRHSKQWILDNYINDVPFGAVNGENAIGVGAAAQSFFDKPVWKLDLAQMALLAGLPQSPTLYNPFRDPQVAKQRRHDVLQAMVSSHYISQALADAVDRQGLQTRANSTYVAHQEPFVFDYVLQQLANKLCPRHPDPLGCRAVKDGGLKVYTTIDLRMQQLARAAILAHQGGTIIKAQPGAALAAVDPNTGHILALAQSAPYGTVPKAERTTYDYPVYAQRQPGSSFKVFALMTLIHAYNGDPSQTFYTSMFLPAGWLPSDPTWSVHTAEGSYAGRIDLTQATIASDNTVFVQLAADLGWSKIDEIAHAMGITSPLAGNPSEVIGGISPGVTPLEMADAYATIANGGWHVPATILDHIVLPNGKTVSYGNPTRTKVFTDGETAAAINILKQVITNGTGNPYTYYGCPAAGKTGTANNQDNAWFVGFTPKLSTAVWVGYPQGNYSMASLPSSGFGGPTAGPIWHDFMARASAGYCGDWPAPTTPWSGTAFVGPHSSAKAPPPSKPDKKPKSKPDTKKRTPPPSSPPPSSPPPSGPPPPPASGGTGLP